MAIELVSNNVSGNLALLPAYNKQAKRQKLKKDGMPKTIAQNKKKGKKSEVFHIEVEDMRKITAYFKDKELWLFLNFKNLLTIKLYKDLRRYNKI